MKVPFRCSKCGRKLKKYPETKEWNYCSICLPNLRKKVEERIKEIRKVDKVKERSEIIDEFLTKRFE